jgi:hypothetical protein
MGAPERRLIDDVLRGMDLATERLFRINAGVGWTGRVVRHAGGGIVLANARPLRAAPAGWPDLFGWKTITITPEMVWMKLAVARGVEIKAAGGQLRPEQERFAGMLMEMGGSFEVVHGDPRCDETRDLKTGGDL